MKIDCHCHIFDNRCVPMAGMLASRFGVAVGNTSLQLLEDLKNRVLNRSWLNYFTDVSIDPSAVFDSLTDHQEKDNLLFILEHLDDFIAFLMIGAADMDRVVKKLQQDSPGIDIWVPFMVFPPPIWRKTINGSSWRR